MHQIRRQARSRFSSAQMYALVNDIDSYPQFLPWCAATTVTRHDERSLQATITMAFGPLRKSFTTHNTMTSAQRIDVALVNGPFRHLQGHWLFAARQDGGCDINFALDFAFAGRLVEMTLAPVFTSIAESFIDAFIARAETCYGGHTDDATDRC